MSKQVVTSPSREVRRVTLPQGSKIEVRKNADGSRTVAGDAIVYGTQSQDLGGFIEIIAPGAFTDSLATTYTDVALLYGHDENAICARVSAKDSLTITDTKRALSFKASIAPTSWGNDLVTLLEAELVTGMSFGFAVLDDEWAYVDEQCTRTVKTAILYELSAVPNPAYLSSTVGLRSMPAELRKHVKREHIAGMLTDEEIQAFFGAGAGADADPDAAPVNADGDEDEDLDEQCSCQRSATTCAACLTGDHSSCNAETRCNMSERDSTVKQGSATGNVDGAEGIRSFKSDGDRMDHIRLLQVLARRKAV